MLMPKLFSRKKETMMAQLKHNLLVAQERMKKYADRNITYRQYNVGDMVYLKMQSYRLAASGIKTGLKLATKFYDPYRVLQKFGNSSYKIQLPSDVQVHNVFHISQLKRHLSPNVVPAPGLPLVDTYGKIKVAPIMVLDTRVVPRENRLVPQWLIQWLNMSPEEATSEDADFIKFLIELRLPELLPRSLPGTVQFFFSSFSWPVRSLQRVVKSLLVEMRC